MSNTAATATSSAPEYLGIIGGSSYLKSAYFNSDKFKAETRTTVHGQVKLYINRSERVVFVQRHAADPDVAYSPPHLINTKAIIAALKTLNCKRILGFNSTGSMKRTIDLGTLVVPDDFLCLRPISFFTDARAHLIPGFDADFRLEIINALKNAEFPPVTQAVYVQTDGPRFETAAEIRLFAREADIVGMTAAHEAILTKEVGIKYATVCMIDNWANGVNTRELTTEEFHQGVAKNLRTMESVLDVMVKNFKPKSDDQSNDDGKTSQTTVDQILHARWIVPMAPGKEETVLEHHSLAIKNGAIVAILPKEEMIKQYWADCIEDLSDSHVIQPGLINAHTHLGMTLLRGYSDDKALLDWLTQDIWPTEGKFMSHAFVRAGAMLGAAEMIRSGTTCFNDMYFHADATAEVVDETGMRAVVGLPIIEFPDASVFDGLIEEGKRVMKKYGHLKQTPSTDTPEGIAIAEAEEKGGAGLPKPHPRLNFAICPHAPYTVTDTNYVRAIEFAKSQGIPLHTHLHEQPTEVTDSIALDRSSPSCHKSTNPVAPLDNLHKLGVTCPNLVAVHMTQLTDEQIKIVAQTGTHVVHCPNSNLKLASGTLLCIYTRIYLYSNILDSN